jgi:hypothetical protein
MTEKIYRTIWQFCQTYCSIIDHRNAEGEMR